VAEHPLVREYTILSALKTSGVVPQAYYLSGPLQLPTSSACPRIVPGRFDIPEEYKKCQELGTEVRFLVQEKVGPTVDRYIKHLERKLDGSSENDLRLLRAAITIARKTFYMVQRLHLYGIVHGDIHGSNIAFTDVDVDFDTVDITHSSFVMIDFGLAVYFPDDYGSSTISPPGNELRDWLLSPWQLLNYRKGRRDDIIRTVDLVATFLTRGRLHKGFKALVGDGSVTERRSTAAEIKFLLPVFKPSSLLKSEALLHLKSISLDKRRQIQTTLELIRSSVLMQHPHPDSGIDYLRLDFEFVNLLNRI
jgi:serine/threonine protein kinase